MKEMAIQKMTLTSLVCLGLTTPRRAVPTHHGFLLTQKKRKQLHHNLCMASNLEATSAIEASMALLAKHSQAEEAVEEELA